MKRGGPITPKSNHRKTKSKSKSKSKQKKFDPLIYLNSLINQLHDKPHHSIKKKGGSAIKRDLASAMAHTTPHTQRTAASSKVRSRSSYSQFRRKSVTLKEALKIDLNELSEDDNIQFTENTVRQSEILTSPEKVQLVTMSKTTAAIKIQRAWRNYQTLKVIKKYYDFYKGLMIRQKELKQLQNNIKPHQDETIKKNSEHTLKIRKQQRHSPNTTLKISKPVNRILQFSDHIENVVTKEIIKENYELGEGEMRTIQLPVLKQTQIKSEYYPSKELELIFQLFKNNQENASKQVQEQLNAYCRAQEQLAFSDQKGNSRYEDRGSSLFRQQDSSMGQIEGLSPIVFAQMQAAVKQKYQLFRSKVQKQMNVPSQEKRRTLDQLEGRLIRQTRAIQNCKHQYMRSVYQLRQNMLKLQNDNAIISKMNQLPLRVRKSYSADSLLMKSILQEVSFKNVELDITKERDRMGLVLENSFKKKGKNEEGMGLNIPTSPPSVFVEKDNPNSGRSALSGRSLECYQTDNAGKLRQMVLFQQQDKIEEALIPDDPSLSEESSQSNRSSNVECQYPCIKSQSDDLPQLQPLCNYRQGERSRIIRQEAESIALQLQALMIWQLVEELYLDNKMWSNFKTLVQIPYTFRSITDNDIRIFLQSQLPKYYLKDTQWFLKMNQKINPTSMQILRLIRDFQFQVDQYELVLPQQVFKAYRKELEDDYALIIKHEKEKKIDVIQELKGSIRDVVVQRGEEKRNKKAKFISFQRDLRIMYMKSVFNCFNELIIETKSFSSFMNGRSSIGPGQLTLSLKQYNNQCSEDQAHEMITFSKNKILQLLSNKCQIPQFKNHRDLELFQKQMNGVISKDLNQCEYKWVNYMDQVLQMWQQISLWLSQQLLTQFVEQAAPLF